jgi:hypothetical protein
MSHYDEFYEMTMYDAERAYKDENVSAIARQKILDVVAEAAEDVMQVFDFGAAKHPDSGDTPNFLTPNGNKCSLKDRGSSILRHAARTFMDPGMLDEESNLPELLHLMSSIIILYIRHKRNIIHPKDEESSYDAKK